MTYSVTIERQVTENYQDCPRLPALVSMEVQTVVGFLDKGIFVHRIDPDTGVETYSHVATPCDIEQVLFDAGTGPFVRRDSMEITYQTASLADAGIAEIEQAVRDLCVQMDRIDDLGPATLVTITS